MFFTDGWINRAANTAAYKDLMYAGIAIDTFADIVNILLGNLVGEFRSASTPAWHEVGSTLTKD